MKSRTNAEAALLLEEIRGLMQLRGENPFKVRAYERASSAISALGADEDLGARATAGTLTELEGIGKGIAEVLTEFFLKGKTSLKDELSTGLPAGLMELTQIPGLGPKKAIQLIEELDIHSIQELEYACKENRLLKIKGFGDKLQSKILSSIQFMKTNQGQQRIDDAFAHGDVLFKAILKAANHGRHPAASSLRVSETGPLRRRLEVMSSLDFLIELPPGEKASEEVRTFVQNEVNRVRATQPAMLPVNLHFAPTARFGYELARTTGTEEHWRALEAPAPFDAVTEEEFFERLELPVIPAEARETGEEVRLARSGAMSELLPWDGVTGIFHNHTTRSDGGASLEEMVIGAKKLGYHYIGISDHSQSAFYAQGLKVPTLVEQEQEIREVQERHPDIRIFWGIESDILADGSLDYEAKVLERFDFVVASIHSRFQMDRDTMTNRILEAVRNPHTRFLGHCTGRLLLGRKGYEVDLEKVIAEAAKRDVAIEINANPARLDIDWRWGPKLRECGTQVSINPDAHAVEGLEDTKYGIAMARKALLPKGCVVNARSVKEVERWLKRA